MSYYFYGDSHAARYLRLGATRRGLKVTHTPMEAQVLFVSQDTPTDRDGNRDLDPIRALVQKAIAQANGTQAVVITSQVPPGFTRGFGDASIFYQAETLRVTQDTENRAVNPEQLIVGGPGRLVMPYLDYLLAFKCPIMRMSWEDAEFAKIAINMMLAAQVDATNMLAEAAAKVNADWEKIREVLQNDKRIGKYAYLTPGRWQDSLHLLRDYRTLEAIRSTS